MNAVVTPSITGTRVGGSTKFGSTPAGGEPAGSVFNIAEGMFSMAFGLKPRVDMIKVIKCLKHEGRI